MNPNQMIAALVDAVNSSTRPPALWPLARIKYPERELRPQVSPDGSLSVSLSLYGWEYKHRGPRPRTPPRIDAAAVQAALNTALPDGLTVIAVQKYDNTFHITIKER